MNFLLKTFNDILVASEARGLTFKTALNQLTEEEIVKVAKLYNEVCVQKFSP